MTRPAVQDPQDHANNHLGSTLIPLLILSSVLACLDFVELSICPHFPPFLFDFVSHAVVPTIKIQEHAGNDKSYLWHGAVMAN